MKKIICTLSFVVACIATGKAQTVTPQPQEPKKTETKPAASKKMEGEQETIQPKPATRMAINEKGVPSTKPATGNKAARTEKVAAPAGQPAPGEEKK